MATAHLPFSVTLPNGEPLSVVWKPNSRSRSLRLSWGPRGAVASGPPRTPRILVQAFLDHQSSWLQAHMQKSDALPVGEVLYLGERHQVRWVSLPLPEHAESRVAVRTPELIVHAITLSSDSVRNTLDRWLQTRASEVATPLLQQLSQEMEVEVPQLRFRETHSRWGSCSSTGAITLNWRLIHTPEQVIRYVVVHELAHRVHLNHSDRFWSLVEKHQPTFRIDRGWLKRNGQWCRSPELQVESVS